MLEVRRERPADFAAIGEVVRAAFGRDAVVELVERIRASEDYVPELALVAEQEGSIVGHVMLSRCALASNCAAQPILVLSPLSVAPAMQRRGVGSTLVRAAIAAAEEAGEPLIVLEGSPAYYPRFGFEPVSSLGIELPLPAWAPLEAAMAFRLPACRPALHGLVVLPTAFEVVAEEDQMSATDELLANAQAYASSFDKGELPIPPAKGVAVIACMDSRLNVFALLGLQEGDAHVIRNAGGVVTDDGIRSLAISQRLLGTKEIVLIHHTDCGMLTLTDDGFKRELEAETGITPEWAVEAFDDLEADVRQSIGRIEASPFIPNKDSIRGFVYDVKTGVLKEVS